MRKQKPQHQTQHLTLTGWRKISEFLGAPTSVVQRWKRQGMPVHRQGRNVTAAPEELNTWLSRESGKPLQVATEETDLASELKRGLAFVRHKKLNH
jgi:phage terminase Nu1 subunit (DNA packaging protein)